MASQTGNSTEELKNNVKQDVASAKEEIAGSAKVKAETGKEQAANKLNDLSDAIEKMASGVSADDKLGLASYVHSASSQLSALASRLQDRSVDELAEDAKQLARSKPGVFLLGSVALGFGLSRFVKAAAHPGSAVSPM